MEEKTKSKIVYAVLTVVVIVAGFFGFKVTFEEIPTTAPVEQVQQVEAK